MTVFGVEEMGGCAKWGMLLSLPAWLQGLDTRLPLVKQRGVAGQQPALAPQHHELPSQHLTHHQEEAHSSLSSYHLPIERTTRQPQPLESTPAVTMYALTLTAELAGCVTLPRAAQKPVGGIPH